MLTAGDVRTRVLAAIDAALGPDADPAATAGAWRESRVAWDQYPPDDTRDLEHHGYAVGIGASQPIDGQRQRASEGVIVSTDVSVRWSHRLRADGLSADYTTALACEAELVAALRGTGRDPELDVLIGSIPARRVTSDPPIFVGEVVCSVMHRYPLT